MANYIEEISMLVNLVMGSGIIGMLIFYRSKKRKEKAEAAKAETSNEIMIAAEWKEVAEKREKQIDLKDAKIEELYVSINQWRDRNNELSAENHALRLEQLSAKYMTCNRRQCSEREPQTGY